MHHKGPNHLHDYLDSMHETVIVSINSKEVLEWVLFSANISKAISIEWTTVTINVLRGGTGCPKATP